MITALQFTIDTGTATIICALIVCLQNYIQQRKLAKQQVALADQKTAIAEVHTLVNSNLTEAKAGRAAAEAALDTAKAINLLLRQQNASLQEQLDTRTKEGT